ncbi:MAG: hypothetical protein B1H12_04525 [Desulfobacteraceae bacterium 4484_190.2]|nr:MAG: hypothetical protein B1H12_04525 [Desulfobacteraceae bacterium 4484_190.2]
MHGTGHLRCNALKAQIIKLPTESQVWARGKLQIRNLGVSLLNLPPIGLFNGHFSEWGNAGEKLKFGKAESIVSV